MAHLRGKHRVLTGVRGRVRCRLGDALVDELDVVLVDVLAGVLASEQTNQQGNLPLINDEPILKKSITSIQTPCGRS